MPNGSINYLFRGRNLRFLHPHRLKQPQLPYTVDPNSQLLQQVRNASTAAVLIINIHCFSNPAREWEVELKKADQRARVEEDLNLFHEAAYNRKTTKTVCTDKHKIKTFTVWCYMARIFNICCILHASGPPEESHTKVCLSISNITLNKVCSRQRI